MVNMGQYLPKKGKVCENNECGSTRYFHRLFHLEANISPYYPRANEISSISLIQPISKS